MALFEIFDNTVGALDKSAPLTPVEKIGGIYLKRDDTFEVHGVQGGKARTCYALIKQGQKNGDLGVVTAGARQSPQIQIVANIAQGLGLKCRVHTIRGSLTEELTDAVKHGADVVVHDDTWHNNVIISRATVDAQESGYTDVPFGMECWEAVRQTMNQVQNIPKEVKRIVVPVGSGMSFAGILWGLKRLNRKIDVLGVQVGANPYPRLQKYAPNSWRNMVTMVKSETPYHTYIDAKVGDVQLDPVYEAKCYEYLEEGDLLWIVGIRK